jgi:tetratricopeptide (TPR) repeat protein
LSQLDQIRQSLEEVEPFLAKLADNTRSARHAAFRCNHHFLAGEQRLAIEFGEDRLRLARRSGDRSIQGELLYRIAQSYHLLGQNRKAIRLFEESLDYTIEEPERNRFGLRLIPAVVSRTWLVSVLTECGDFQSGLDHAKDALKLAETTQQPLSEVLGQLAMGHLLRRKGELNGAIGYLERGMALCDRYSLPLWHLRLISSLGLAYARCGRHREGVDLARQALVGAQKIGLIVDQPMFLVNLGQASLLAARVDDASADRALALDDALTCGKQALELALAHEAKGVEAWARFLIARASWASAPNEFEEPMKELELALRNAVACEARPLAAFCQSALADIYVRRGDHAKAHGFNALANSVYSELDMRPLPFDPVR